MKLSLSLRLEELYAYVIVYDRASAATVVASAKWPPNFASVKATA